MSMHDSLLYVASSVDLTSLPNIGDDNLIVTVLEVAIRIIAAVCLLFVVIGGLRYIVSQGDAQGVAKAKGTVIYALLGLAIVILAQFIVIFTVKAVE